MILINIRRIRTLQFGLNLLAFGWLSGRSVGKLLKNETMTWLGKYVIICGKVQIIQFFCMNINSFQFTFLSVKALQISQGDIMQPLMVYIKNSVEGTSM